MKTNETKDRHANGNWEFRQSKDGVRLYRNTKNANIFKRVEKRSGSTSHCWENVTYTMKGQVDRFGNLTWVKSMDDVSLIPSRVAEMEQIYKNNEA